MTDSPTNRNFPGGQPQRRVLLLVNSATGPLMSGPGIRYCELARVLGAVPALQVTLATTPGIPTRPPGEGLPYRWQSTGDERELRTLAEAAGVVVAPGAVASLYPSLLACKAPLVLDLYIPLLLEELQRQQPPAEHALHLERVARATAAQLLAADFVLCASEKQRDFWLGALATLGRINPAIHRDDPTLRRLIDVVPFGLPASPPRHTRQVLKGVYPGIEPEDTVLLWGGGLYDWLDAPTVVRAMAHLAPRRPDLKLFFMGVEHPNPRETQRRGTQETMQLADALGLTGRTVFFNDWVPYAERANYLLEADVAISLHRDHLEARFSFRTRFLDTLWAGLPIVATRGDLLAEQVQAYRLGKVVEPDDAEGVAAAILELVDTPDLRQVYRPRFEQLATRYHWEGVARPLVDFCLAPRHAADRQHVRCKVASRPGSTPWWRLPASAWRALRATGLRGLGRQLAQYARWLRNRRGKG